MKILLPLLLVTVGVSMSIPASAADTPATTMAAAAQTVPRHARPGAEGEGAASVRFRGALQLVLHPERPRRPAAEADDAAAAGGDDGAAARGPEREGLHEGGSDPGARARAGRDREQPGAPRSRAVLRVDLRRPVSDGHVGVALRGTPHLAELDRRARPVDCEQPAVLRQQPGRSAERPEEGHPCARGRGGPRARAARAAHRRAAGEGGHQPRRAGRHADDEHAEGGDPGGPGHLARGADAGAARAADGGHRGVRRRSAAGGCAEAARGACAPRDSAR